MKFFKFFMIINVILAIIFYFGICVFAESTLYVWSNNSNSVETSEEVKTDTQNKTNSTTNSDIETSTEPESSEENPLGLESESAILIEQNSGQILYSHNIHEQLRPASVTKLMSILLIMEQINDGKLSLTDTISCSENAAHMGGSQIWLDTRETLTVDEMLKAICVVSANDCVVAMAEHIAGSEEAFVEMMNNKAKELGMNDTCFKNCHGIDEDGHVTSSYDISLMSRELLNKYPEITKYTTIYMDSLRDGKSELVNTNKLIRTYKGATGLKTGSTGLALYNLSASATRDDLSLIAVIMKAPSTKVRFAEATKLLDYGFSKFSYKQFAKKGDILDDVEVNKGVKSNVQIEFETDAGCLIEKGNESRIEQNMNIEPLQAPIEKGQKVGSVTYSLDGNTLSTVNLVASTNVDSISLFSMSKSVIYNWINLLRK